MVQIWGDPATLHFLLLESQGGPLGLGRALRQQGHLGAPGKLQFTSQCGGISAPSQLYHFSRGRSQMLVLTVETRQEEERRGGAWSAPSQGSAVFQVARDTHPRDRCSYLTGQQQVT